MPPTSTRISASTCSARERTATASGHPDFSLLLDGLVAEREQGITIDIAWRYFDTDTRRFVIIDIPGPRAVHAQHGDGASHADVAILLVDARHGVKRQTRRHAAILDLVGVKHVVLAVNKMDLVDWSRRRFREIEPISQRAGEPWLQRSAAIPVSAAPATTSPRPPATCPGMSGRRCSSISKACRAGEARMPPFRMPVQIVLRDGHDFRGLAGTVSSGTVRVGDGVTDALSGLRPCRAHRHHGRRSRSAAKGEAVTLQLDTDLDVARGAVLAAPGAVPVQGQNYRGPYRLGRGPALWRRA